jgi:DNA-binding transcriptional MerR regulator
LTFLRLEGLYFVQNRKERGTAMQKYRQRVSTSPSQQTALPLQGGTIGELARRTGLTTKAIRYYESIGVLPPSPRGANGYRCYSQADVNRLNLLRRLRLLGISLAEARSLLTATLDAPCRDVQHELSHLVTARLVALDQEIAELHQLREELACCQQQLISEVVEKDEPFTTCYDQACLACSPSPLPPQAPVTVLPRKHHGVVTTEVDG